MLFVGWVDADGSLFKALGWWVSLFYHDHANTCDYTDAVPSAKPIAIGPLNPPYEQRRIGKVYSTAQVAII